MKEKDKNKDKEKEINEPKVSSLTFEEYKEIYDNSWTNFQRIAIHLLKEGICSKPK
jgi:hypothetical protein